MKPALSILTITVFYVGQSSPFTAHPSVKGTATESMRGRSFFSTKNSLKPVSDSKNDAIESLEKLLMRQKAELLETERLLKSFNDDYSKDGHASPPLSSFAASLVSGFDYGFVSRNEGASFSELRSAAPGLEGYGPPANIFSLGAQQFMRNWNAMAGEYKDEEDVELSPKQRTLRAKLDELTLNSTAIWERELQDGPIQAPYVIKGPYLFLCWMLDTVFEGRNVPARFFLLETVARMPYFAYIGMLHFYETLGFWRRSADMKRVHFAEETNEFHHLLIMESLGGDQLWWVRAMAAHSAIAYFFGLCFLWALSPTVSYKFSELLETHAVNTYGQFLEENEEILKELPPSMVAVQYYSFGSSDPFYAEIQTQSSEIRRPGENMKSLFDTFSAICADEGDHVSTMQACMDPNVSVRSPSLEKKILVGVAFAAALGYVLSTGDVTDMMTSENVDLTSSGAIDASTSALTSIADGSLVETALGGLGAFASQFMIDEEELSLVDIASEIVEASTVGAILGTYRTVVADTIRGFMTSEEE